jgi:hypothetical protein
MTVIFYLHIMHNNLFTNIRILILSLRPRSIYCCLCVSFSSCKVKACRYICNDQCFKPHTLIKWGLMYIIFWTLYALTQSNGELIMRFQEDLGLKEGVHQDVVIETKYLLIAFAAHHFLFLVFRIFFVIIFQLFCCGHSCCPISARSDFSSPRRSILDDLEGDDHKKAFFRQYGYDQLYEDDYSEFLVSYNYESGLIIGRSRRHSQDQIQKEQLMIDLRIRQYL